MQTDRRTLRWVNGFGAILAAGLVVGIAFLAASHDRAARPKALPPRVVDRWKARRLAVAAERRNDYADAERRYLGALALDPGAQDLRLRLAHCRLHLGKPLSAFEDLRPLVEPCLGSEDQPPGGFDTLVWYADFATLRGRRADAERAVRLMGPKVVRRPVGKPLLVEAHLRAACLVPDGLLHARRAAQLDPSSVGTLLTTSGLLDEASMKGAADRMLGQARRRLRTSGDWITLAEFEHYSERYDDAFSALDRAGRLIPDRDAPSWSRVARTLEFMADERRVRLGSPSHLPSVVALVYRSRLGSAVAKAMGAVAPDDGRTLLELAEVCGRLRDSVRRLRLAEASRRATPPRDVEASVRLALLFMDSARQTEGRTMLRQTRPFADAEQRRRIDQWLSIVFREGESSGDYGIGTIRATPGSLGTPFGQRAY